MERMCQGQGDFRIHSPRETVAGLTAVILTPGQTLWLTKWHLTFLIPFPTPQACGEKPQPPLHSCRKPAPARSMDAMTD